MPLLRCPAFTSLCSSQHFFTEPQHAHTFSTRIMCPEGSTAPACPDTKQYLNAPAAQL